MELKQIFRHEGRQLYEHVHLLHSRYGRLREKFGDFVGLFPPTAGKFPEEMEFLPAEDKSYLLVKYCGKKFRFCFDMIEQQQGQVRCLVSSPNDGEDEEPQELGRFTFNGNGFTNIVPPGSKDADLLEIHHGACAYAIVASFLAAEFSD